MNTDPGKSFIQTLKERCRMCYTCVRECPAKAIRIVDGQAEVIPERCITCGNCVRVCSQKAKTVLSSTDDVRALLRADVPVAACLAPSFPAEFTDMDSRKLVGMLRAAGFTYVNEVGFGADLVAKAYRELVSNGDRQRHIATTCPAIVAYVERYFPDMIDHLAPLVSPMIAIAQVLRGIHGPHLKTVFVGPCIAKKYESDTSYLPGEIDGALTFVELREILEQLDINPSDVEASDFDPPHSGPGAIFSLSRGMLQAAKIEEDLMSGEVVAADGRSDFVQAIREFEDGDLDARLLETLACKGCIMGAGMSSDEPLFSRRSSVARYVRGTLVERGSEQWEADMAAYGDVDLSRTYSSNDQRIPVPSKSELRLILSRMGKETPEDELNCGACGYESCVEHAIAIYKGLAETEMCLPNAIETLRSTVDKLADSNTLLANTQEALKHSEKLASMGQLAAGIAHELNNPLGVVIMYAHLLQEEAENMDSQSQEDLDTIAREADRCKKIVSGLLHFARQNKVVRMPVNLAELVRRALKTSQMPDNINSEIVNELDDQTADMDGDQILQVISNLMSNAAAAMENGGSLNIIIAGNEREVTIKVSDTGTGISKENMDKIFDPFFTTKQIGMGTGLGLAVTYGIIKMHQGSIEVESNADPAEGPTGTTFTITLPRHGGEK